MVLTNRPLVCVRFSQLINKLGAMDSRLEPQVRRLLAGWQPGEFPRRSAPEEGKVCLFNICFGCINEFTGLRERFCLHGMFLNV